ncbi:MAG: sulfatase-like hydrolase/transferase [Chitinivibrionales bacterium]|nr:sulfatase-like hydrolase/transferase [Chitinivibrionales bacterium]
MYPDLLERAGYHVGFCRKGWGPGRVKPGGRKRNPAGREYKTFGDFLAQRPADKPFCFWFGSRDPHRFYGPRSRLSPGINKDAVSVPPFLPDNDTVRNDLAHYLFEVRRFDRDVGVQLEMLRRRRELENTLVVMTSDNGMPFPRCKATCYDPGVHVPLVIWWPGHIKAGTTLPDFVNLADLAPTFLEAANVQTPSAMSGKSLWRLLDGNGRRSEYVVVGRERHSAAQGTTLKGYPVRAIRTDNFLYVRNFKPGRWPVGTPPQYRDVDRSPTKRHMLHRYSEGDLRELYELSFAKRPAEELYDLRSDPHQLVNVARRSSYASDKRRLSEILMRELTRTGDPRARGGGDVFDTYPFYMLKRLHQ